MDNERVREFCLALPHVVETFNWGSSLVFWVGDKAIGGKSFAMVSIEQDNHEGHGILWFPAGPERFHELIEIEGLIPAPYLARAHWVALERWDAMRSRDIQDELRRSHALILAKLPKRTHAILAMPEKERDKLIRERRKLLEEQESAKKEKAAQEKAARNTNETKVGRIRKAK